MIRKLFILVLIFSVLVLQLFAQQKDFGFWTSLDIEKEFTRNLDIEFGIANRLQDNLNQRDETFADIGLSYKYKRFAAGFGYRFTNNKDEQPSVTYSHRMAWQLRYRPEWKRFTFDFRTRFQSQYFGILSSELGTIPENYLRNRMKASYNVKKSPLDPFISFESFYRMQKDKVSDFQRNRFTAGVEFKINKNNDIELSYIYHETFNVRNPKNNHILSLGYSIEL